MFQLSREEFLNVFFDDLALPDAGNAKVRVIDATPPGPPICWSCWTRCSSARRR